MINRCCRLLEVKRDYTSSDAITESYTCFCFFLFFFFFSCRSEELRGGLRNIRPVYSTDQMASQGEGIRTTRKVQVLGGDREPARLCLHSQWTSCSIVLQSWLIFYQEHSQGKKREGQSYCLNIIINYLIIECYS